MCSVNIQTNFLRGDLLLEDKIPGTNNGYRITYVFAVYDNPICRKMNIRPYIYIYTYPYLCLYIHLLIKSFFRENVSHCKRCEKEECGK